MARWVPAGAVNTFRVQLADQDEPLVVRSSVGDVVAWERQHKALYHENVGVSSMLWLAWKAARRLGVVTDPTFEQFSPRVIDLEVETEDEDPTQTDLSDT